MSTARFEAFKLHICHLDTVLLEKENAPYLRIQAAPESRPGSKTQGEETMWIGRRPWIVLFFFAALLIFVLLALYARAGEKPSLPGMRAIPGIRS